ncbi:hypothetical protein FHS23_000403 [Prauserella isguenensis]|uniref:DUF4913 domain-containing protein n=1 Tax=Prauserella isguenensis TaxID=1470180 RepID=A0A839RUN0_9PSEU|nr:hypothetical protein [Prauserella isguenensis]MBB3049408.1 hypothetical protein [Prauserella isguenensis]
MSETPEYATAEAVSGVALEVDGLRRRFDQLDNRLGPVEAWGARLDAIEQQLAETVEKLRQLVTAPGQSTVASWLALPEDDEQAQHLMAELVAWLQTVFLRYPDAAEVLPDCWAWHPEVVEELLWLMQAWSSAYFDQAGGVLRVADWHDRYRPGVVRRLSARAGKCSLENHTSPAGAPVAPLAESAGQLAEWWATSRRRPAPEPSDEQFAAAAPRRTRGGMRR